MKVANLVRACFPYVFAHGLITQAEIDEFLKPGSGSVFGMGNKFPVLKVDDGSGDLSFTTDTEKEYSAFYKPDTCSLSFGGKNYLLSCQFRNKGVDDVMSWLKQKGMTEDVINELMPMPTKSSDVRDKPRQLISYGAPGTGKSFKVNETTEKMPAEDVVRTTFHPDSDYATFVGAYKPVMEVDDYETVVTTGEKTAGGTVTKKDGLVRQRRIAYEFVPQAFMQAYVRAWRNLGAAKSADGEDAAPVVLVIEEINRGNCAQIFGDLFQLLDRNDAGWSSYAINADVDLARWLKDEFAGAHQADGEDHCAIVVPSDVGASLPKGVALKDVISGRKLLLPPNLYIWATMNTSDQSLFPIDSAFKRRWDWKYVPIAKPKDKDADWKERVIVANGQKFDWWRFLEIVNAQILEATKSEDKQLGYFFVKAPDATGEISASQFTGKVLFYLYNDVFRDETPPANLFGDGSDGNTQYRFKMFFDEQGEPKEDVVAAFLAQLFKKKSEKGKPAEASAGDAAKGTDEA